MKYNKYSNTELKKLLGSIVILIDTREKSIERITDYFREKNINYKIEKLDHGDYSCMIPKNEELGIYRDIYFTDVVSIERKGNLEELSGNFTQGRARIENEFLRAKGKLILLVENGTYEDIILWNYNTQYKSISFVATLKTFEARYGIETNFIKGKYTGNFIYMTLMYHVKESLKNGRLGQAI